jgi:hypothetical protein
VRAHAVGAPMANGADFQIDGFHRAEGPFYSGEKAASRFTLACSLLWLRFYSCPKIFGLD